MNSDSLVVYWLGGFYSSTLWLCARKDTQYVDVRHSAGELLSKTRFHDVDLGECVEDGME